MKKLEIKGLKNIDGMEFHDIEGGFGENKKAMLVKEIAEIHNQPLGEINRRINDNRKRFKDGIDIVDLVGTNFAMGLSHNGIYSQNALNASKNIYLLSERGYSKLLKLLEDDIAWEQYEKLVDGYFNMREKENQKTKKLSALEQLQLQNDAILEVNEKVDKIKNDMPLFKAECDELQSLVRKTGINFMGGKKSPSYKDNSLRGKVYFDIQQQLRREFGVDKYAWIKHSQFNRAKEIVSSYKLPTVLKDEIVQVNNQISFNEEAM